MNPNHDEGNQRRRNALDYLNQGTNAVRQGAQALQITETIASTFTLGGIAAVVIISTTFFLMFFLGKPSQVAGGNSVNPMPIDQVKQYVIVDYTTNSSSIDNKTNEPGQNITDPKELNFIYNTFAIPLGSANYRKLLSNSDGTPRPIHIFFFDALPDSKTGKSTAGISSTGGAGYGPTNMAFWGFWELYNAKSNNVDLQAHILIHESGHIIQKRSLWPSGFDFNTLGTQDNGCYDAGWLKTYAYRTDSAAKGEKSSCQVYPYSPPDSYRTTEDEAEALANNVFCAPGASCDYNKIYCSTATVYNGSCNSTYNWIKKNIFGGDDFFSSGQTGPNSNMCSGFYAGPASVEYTDAYNSTVVNKKAGYNIYIHKGENFGDPNCDLVNSRDDPVVQDKILNYLKTIDPVNAATWWTMIPCESNHSFSPLAYNPNSTSQLGAYGLLQMNPSINPYTGKSRGSTTDIGDVTWQQQLQNAVDRSKHMTYFSDYWGCGPKIPIK
jgi:hypothetical protein